MPRNNVIDESDAIELAAYVMNRDPWADDYDEDEVIDAFEELYGLDMDTFAKLATKLAKFTIPTESPLSQKKYQGFVKDGAYICKIEVK